MEFQSKVKHKILSGQTREVIANVVRFMQQEAQDNPNIPSFKKVRERVSLATGVSFATIRRIILEMKSIEKGDCISFSTPNQKRIRAMPKSDLDDNRKGLLRQCITKLYEEKEIPTLRRIHTKFVEDAGYQGSRETLRKVMREMGYYWRKTDHNKRVLTERPIIQQNDYESECEDDVEGIFGP